MRRAIVAGALAAKPGNAGGAWERMSYAVGLKRLGWDVLFIEEVREGLSPTAVTWVNDCTRWFDIPPLLVRSGDPSDTALFEAEECDLLINLSGNLKSKAILNAAKVTAFIDVDPGFTQIWLEKGSITLPRHDHYFTIGEAIGTPACPLPTGGLFWKHTRQPVLLDQWTALHGEHQRRFSTMSSWRSFGAVTWDGVTYPQKHHEFRRLIDLPKRLGEDFEIVLDIHAGDDADKQKFIEHGWHIESPDAVSTPAAFRDYIQQSAAEFSVCQGVYSAGRTGWFSDRSVRYLASGKPVLVPDTGSPVPSGAGLVTFTTLEEAAAGAEAILRDYDRHSCAARRLAEEWFDSDKVLTKLLHDCGLEAT